MNIIWISFHESDWFSTIGLWLARHAYHDPPPLPWLGTGHAETILAEFICEHYIICLIKSYIHFFLISIQYTFFLCITGSMNPFISNIYTINANKEFLQFSAIIL